ncbi:MAG: hypothetical protein D6730_08785 [Bacteroidetes bacterium]|nr:MAG: hypothetical protein D6730_08785 [Bacteroidota bacterium]
MSKQEHDWIDEVMESMQGARPAQPPADLLGRIEDRLQTEGRVVPLSRWRWAVAAAMLLIGLNLWSWSQLARSRTTAEEAGLYSQTSLISTYNLYE